MRSRPTLWMGSISLVASLAHAKPTPEAKATKKEKTTELSVEMALSAAPLALAKTARVVAMEPSGNMKTLREVWAGTPQAHLMVSGNPMAPEDELTRATRQTHKRA